MSGKILSAAAGLFNGRRDHSRFRITFLNQYTLFFYNVFTVRYLRMITVKTMIKRWMSVRRIISYIGIRISAIIKPGYVPFLPVTLDIEPNNTCNLRCPHCQVTYWKKERSYLDAEGFGRILDQFPGLVRIKLQGMGEPMLNDQFLQMLKEGERRGIAMNIVTNGTVCRGEVVQALLELEGTEITFSLDGASAAVFEKIRVGSSFAGVTENIRNLTTARGDRKWPRITGWTVVTADNISELSSIVRYSADLGLDDLTIQTFLSDWGKPEMRVYTGPVRIDLVSPVLAESVKAAKSAAAECGVRLQVASHDHYSNDNKCPWPWKSAFITASGDVVPCCIVADPDTMKMGNLFEEDFRTIWNSPGYRKLRSRIKSGDLPEFCRNCYGE